MKNSIARALAIGCEIKLQLDYGKCYMHIWHPETMNGRDGYYTLDDNFEISFSSALDNAVKELLLTDNIELTSKNPPTHDPHHPTNPTGAR